MLIVKPMALYVGLLLAAIEVAPHRAHHLGAIAPRLFPKTLGGDVLAQQLAGTQRGTVAPQPNPSDPCATRCDERFREMRAVHRIPVDDQIHFAPALLAQPPAELILHTNRWPGAPTKDVCRPGLPSYTQVGPLVDRLDAVVPSERRPRHSTPKPRLNHSQADGCGRPR
jgi:hypothetical protein